VWDAFGGIDEGPGSRRRAVTHWAALSAISFAQDGINLMWVEGGRSLAKADRGEGLTRSEVRDVTDRLVATGILDVLDMEVPVTADVPAADLRAALLAATAGRTMEDIDLWAVTDGRAIAGMALILLTLARCPDPAEADRAWSEIVSVTGDWQPSLVAVGELVRDLIDAGATVGVLFGTLFERLVIRAHEDNAYSKLPDFTFRWRREAGRLRLYPHRTDWDLLADMRAGPISSLLVDLGLARTDATTITPTADGDGVIGEVFG
jgi:hypothetical protein